MHGQQNIKKYFKMISINDLFRLFELFQFSLHNITKSLKKHDFSYSGEQGGSK